MRFYTTLIFLFFALFSLAQPPGRMKLTQLERGPVDTVRRGYIGMTDTAGNQRYTRYVQNLNSCLTYTPGPFETNPFYFSKFVRRCGTDSIFYIDYTGLVQPINSGGMSGLPTVTANKAIFGTGSPGYAGNNSLEINSTQLQLRDGKSFQVYNAANTRFLTISPANDTLFTYSTSPAGTTGYKFLGRKYETSQPLFLFADVNNATWFQDWTRLNSSVPVNVSGINSYNISASDQGVRRMTIEVDGLNPVTLLNESTLSAASYRFSIGSDLVLNPGDIVHIWYSWVIKRWKIYDIKTTAGSGITSLNGLTASTQTFATGTTGTDFNISSTGSAHTFNIPEASASATGKVNTGVQTFAGVKTFQNDVICQDELRVTGGVLDVGANATTPGVINVYGATSGAVQIAVPAAPTTYVFTLPPDDGTAGQVLTTDGTGITSWAATGGSPVVITPSNITETQNNYSPTGWITATVVFLSTNGTEIWGITGFSSSGLSSGHTKRLVNTSKAQIYIAPNHPSSSSANRVTGDSDFILGYGKSVDIVFNGSTWFLLGESASPTVYLRWNTGSTTAADWGAVVFTAINSGTVTSTTGPDATTPYMQNMTTAATTNGGGSISMSKTSAKFARINTGHMFIESSLKTPSVLSDATDSYMCGTSFGSITASSVLNSINCIMIRYIHSLNSGNWTLTTINSGGTPTDVDLGVAVAANTRYNLRIEVSDDGLEARAFVNGEMKGISTTTMPANTAEFLAKTQLLKTAGTSDRSLGIISLEAGVHIKY